MSSNQENPTSPPTREYLIRKLGGTFIAAIFQLGPEPEFIFARAKVTEAIAFALQGIEAQERARRSAKR